MTTIHDVAARITEYFDSSISTMKLQKLAFFSQGWSLGLTQQPIFEEGFQAWRDGPVNYDLFQRHRGQYVVSDWTYGNASALSSQESIVVEAVLKNYGALSGLQLSELTHKPDSPWAEARARAGVGEGQSSQVIIDNVAMQEHFSKQLNPALRRH